MKGEGPFSTIISMASRTRSTGSNIAFASILAALSYLPFEIIAKSTLLFCIAIFVLDPFPTSRLVSVGGEYIASMESALANQQLIVILNNLHA